MDSTDEPSLPSFNAIATENSHDPIAEPLQIFSDIGAVRTALTQEEVDEGYTYKYVLSDVGGILGKNMPIELVNSMLGQKVTSGIALSVRLVFHDIAGEIYNGKLHRDESGVLLLTFIQHRRELQETFLLPTNLIESGFEVGHVVTLCSVNEGEDCSLALTGIAVLC